MEGVKVSSQERFHQRINNQIVNIPVSSTAEVLGVPCATPVVPQIVDLRQGWEIVRNHLVWSRVFPAVPPLGVVPAPPPVPPTSLTTPTASQCATIFETDEWVDAQR